jgi:hypothetical protein
VLLGFLYGKSRIRIHARGISSANSTRKWI